jgi:hypothetical protein
MTMTPGEVSYKIDWEGGIFEALDYGLKSSDIEPGALRDAWLKLEQAHAKMIPLVDDVEELLEDLPF